MVVFLIVLGLARCRTSVRLLVETAIVAHAFGHRRWDIALFVAGLLIAEVDVLRSSSAHSKQIIQKKRVKSTLIIVLVLGVFLSGFPRDNATRSLGSGFSKDIWPLGKYRRRFWLSIGAILVVFPMPFLPLLQGFFCTSPMRYLGKISFALYLVHGLGNRTIGIWLLHLTWDVLGKKEIGSML